MEFVGIDLGWEGKPSGLAHLRIAEERLVLSSLDTRCGTVQVLAWIDDVLSDRPGIVAVDAPLVIANQTGMRNADRLMHHHYGRYHAGAYPANLGSRFAALTTGFSRSLTERGCQHGQDIEPCVIGRYQIEVYPHAAIVQLFDLPRIVKYKKGRVKDRVQEMTRYRNLLRSRLCDYHPALDCATLPEIPVGGSLLKRVEDQLDALVCAYLAAYWWYWGTQRNDVHGSVGDGYIVVPKRITLAETPY